MSTVEQPTPKALVDLMERAGLPRVAAGAVLLATTLTCQVIEEATGARFDAGAVASAVVTRILMSGLASPGGAS
jgi:hypothetical protein